MIRALRCFKCHEDTAVLTYEENRIYKVSCPCGCEYTFEHSSQTAAYDYHLKMVELYAEIDRNAALKAENTTLRAQLSASQQRERAASNFIAKHCKNCDPVEGGKPYCSNYGIACDACEHIWRRASEAGEGERDG